MNTRTSKENPTSRANRTSASASAVQSGPRFKIGDPTNYEAWVTKAAKQPMALESVDLGPLGAEDVEVAVEHCGLCHSDLSILNNEWGISQKPRDSRPRGHWSHHSARSECEGPRNRTAR